MWGLGPLIQLPSTTVYASREAALHLKLQNVGSVVKFQFGSHAMSEGKETHRSMTSVLASKSCRTASDFTAAMERIYDNLKALAVRATLADYLKCPPDFVQSLEAIIQPFCTYLDDHDAVWQRRITRGLTRLVEPPYMPR